MKSSFLALSALSILFFTAGPLAPTVASAAPGDLLWEDQFDRSTDGQDWAKHLAVSGRRVFAAGDSASAASSDFSVRAYDAGDGALLWEEHLDPEGGPFEGVQGIIARRGKVVAVGETFSAAGRRGWRVRVYNAADGAVLWTDLLNVEGNGFDRAWSAAIQGGRLFVVGQTATAAGGSAWTVRAYRLKDGSVLWEDYFDREGTAEDQARTVAVEGNRVFVGGFTTTAAGGSAFSVRCYRANNGALIWEDYFDREGSLSDSAERLVVQGKRLFVVGDSQTALTGSDFSIRVYRTRNGALRWEQHVDGGSNGSDEAAAVAVRRGRVFVAGTLVTAAGNDGFGVVAYRTRNGAVLWSDIHDAEGALFDDARDILVQGNKVYAVGVTDTTAGGRTFAVRAYQAKNGSLIWEDNYDRENDEDDRASAIAVRRNSIFVAGHSGTAAGGRGWSVRAYRR